MVNKTWSEIEEEFIKKYVVKSNAGTGLLRYTDADKIIAFFKPYFQEQRHTEAVEELEVVDAREMVRVCWLCKRIIAIEMVAIDGGRESKFCVACGQMVVDNSTPLP